MSRSNGSAAGFGSRAATTFRLRTAVAASIAIGAVSLCLIVAITVLSIKVVGGDAAAGLSCTSPNHISLMSIPAPMHA